MRYLSQLQDSKNDTTTKFIYRFLKLIFVHITNCQIANIDSIYFRDMYFSHIMLFLFS